MANLYAVAQTDERRPSAHPQRYFLRQARIWIIIVEFAGDRAVGGTVQRIIAVEQIK
jgi:hypothetical protein